MEDLIFKLIHSVNKMADKLVDLSSKIDFLSKSPTYGLTKMYITEEESCRILRVCNRVLARMRDNGEIPYYRIRHRITYKASDLEEYIEKHYIH